MIQLPLDVVKLIETAATHPEGSSALFEGHLESVAALYQAHPQTLELLRSYAAQPTLLVEVARIAEGARRNMAVPVPAVAPTQSTPAALIARASAMPNGLELLTHGPVETAATQLGTHAFAVDEAREQLAKDVA